jgi:hypothetical protein
MHINYFVYSVPVKYPFRIIVLDFMALISGEKEKLSVSQLYKLLRLSVTYLCYVRLNIVFDALTKPYRDLFM